MKVRFLKGEGEAMARPSYMLPAPGLHHCQVGWASAKSTRSPAPHCARAFTQPDTPRLLLEFPLPFEEPYVNTTPFASFRRPVPSPIAGATLG
jgi:hypothetical protein